MGEQMTSSGQPIYLTADTHFYHAFMAELRGFSSEVEMNEAIIESWNNKVPVNATVYHLGDFALCGPRFIPSIINQLNCAQIFLVRGNHDGWINCETRKLFGFIKDLHTLKAGDVRAVLSHYALRTWNHAKYGRWQLHGHSHGCLPETKNLQTDVGIDCWNMSPVSICTLARHFQGRTNNLEDYH